MKTMLRGSLLGLLSLGFISCAGQMAAQAADAATQHVLAPSGALLVGVYRGSPTSIIEGATPEDTRGVGYELGRKLAGELGVPFQPVIFASNSLLFAALTDGKVDVAFSNATPARAKDMDFSQTFMAFKKSFLVPAGSPLQTFEAVARPGVRIGAGKGSSTSSELKVIYPAMQIQEIDTLEHAGGMLANHEIDAFATNDAILYQLSDTVPGSQVLPGQWGTEHFAAAVPKGRDAGMAFLRAFITRANADGSIAKAIRNAGLRGTVPVEDEK